MQLKNIFVIIVVFFCLCPSIFAQQNMEDVVYLKNGSVIHGMIIEQIPNVSIKIETKDGNIFVYKINEVSRITKEEPKVQESVYKEEIKKEKEYVRSPEQINFQKPSLGIFGGLGGSSMGLGAFHLGAKTSAAPNSFGGIGIEYGSGSVSYMEWAKADVKYYGIFIMGIYGTDVGTNRKDKIRWGGGIYGMGGKGVITVEEIVGYDDWGNPVWDSMEVSLFFYSIGPVFYMGLGNFYLYPLINISSGGVGLGGYLGIQAW